MTLKISIASDHRGTETVAHVVERLSGQGHSVSNLCAATEGASCDYPDGAFAVGQAVATGEADYGILVCGSGIGMSIAANKVGGVRAALVHDELTAGLARSHNNANVLCLSGDLLGDDKIDRIIEAFLAGEFEGGRHKRRVDKIGAIERGDDPAQAVSE